MAAERCVVFARIQPDQKRALVEALVKNGRRVAMIGDGVNDVPALKASQVAIALGSGSQIAKGVADLVLVGLNFAAIPAAVEEGRKILRNVRRVAKLFVAKSVFAAVLILTVGVGRRRLPVPAPPALARRGLHGRPADLLPRARAARRPSAARAASCASPRLLGARRHGARLRGAARPRARAHRARPLAERVADDVDDDPDLRRPLPRARARVDGACARRSAGRGRSPALCLRARRDLRDDHLARPRRAATSRSPLPPRCRCSCRSSARSSRSARSARSASRSRDRAASASSSSCRSADRADARLRRADSLCDTRAGSGVWRSLVARSVRVGEAPSSNLGTPI